MSLRERSGAVELNVDADLVRTIVAKGRAAFFPMPSDEADMAQQTLELDSGTELSEPPAARLSEETAENATREETAAMIDSLNVDEQAEIIALTWIGRGDFEPAELEVAVREAKAAANGPASTMLMELELFPTLLADGLDRYERWRADQPV